MTENINHRKRAAHERRVREVLTDILNDPEVMPNADCRELLVTIRRIVFGRTVRYIFIDLVGQWRDLDATRSAPPRVDPYIDLTDFMHFPEHLEAVSLELQRRLKLRYTPQVRPLWAMSS
jgi:hypothetical protein